MNKVQLKQRIKQRRGERRRRFIKNTLVVFMLMVFILLIILKVNESEIKEVNAIEHVIVDLPTQQYVINDYVYNSDGWSVNDDYLLAKIAMAEAEGCSIDTKCLVIMTVLNRLKSDKFPNTIEEVIFQKRGNVYQFSPIGDGRWDRVEPNEDCWLAVDLVLTTDVDYSKGALYFESCKSKDNWHSRNLEFLLQSDSMRFYK